MKIQLDMYQTLAAAVLVLLLGNYLKKKIYFLQKFCIPAPVIGGLIFAIMTCICYVTGIAEFSFDDTLREVCMVFFFTSVGFQANLKVLKSGGKSLIVFLGLVITLIILQNLTAVGLAKLLNLNPLIGMCTGSIPMVGGHGTAGAFGPVLEDLNIKGATTICTAAATFGLIFGLLILLNAWRILRLNALQLTREKSSGEKKARFLWPQTILGLAALAFGYYLAVSVKDPIIALVTFFLAVILVMIGTYLLFNAGITVFLHLLKKKKSYYYQPNNMISVSNLIYRMKKNAVGLATIAILSTMVLVTISAATNIYVGSEMVKKIMAPHDFSVQGKGVELEQINQKFDEFASEHHLEIKNRDLMIYANFGVKSQKGTDLTVYPADERSVTPKTVFMVFDVASYEHMTGEKINLTGNQVILFAHNKDLKGQKQFTINGQDFQVKEEVSKDFITDHVPNQFNMLTEDFNYLIVPDLSTFVAQFPNLAIYTNIYGGFNVNVDEDQQLKLAASYDKMIDELSSQQGQGTFIYGGNRANDVAELNSLFGGIFFIGIFLSLIFMVGTVIVIYYKQISEGYEDRERFVILQQVGLDEHEVKRTINRQVRTVFFLPLIFAFIHLAFAYHMIRLILKVLGVINSGQVLVVTLSVCAVFLITYLIVFWITSRSYRKIVQI